MKRCHCWFALAVFSGAAGAQVDAVDLPVMVGEYPVVLTPTRLRQSVTDVPASVTIIQGATLAQYGITSVPEALRLVPGMAVLQASGSDYRINFHGTNALAPRRMNVLIDGMSVYQPAFASVDWTMLPIAVDDIDRIEVTRGPNSAAYGPGSMMAVVNIISKHPADVGRGLASATVGSRGMAAATARTAIVLGQTSVRLTVNHERNDGFDRITHGGRDGIRVDRLNLRSHTRLDDQSALNLDAGYVTATLSDKVTDLFVASDPHDRSENYYLTSQWVRQVSTSNELQVQANFWSNQVRQTWVTCPPTALLLPELGALWRANPSYAAAVIAGRQPTGGSPTDDALAAAATGAIRALGNRAQVPFCNTANQNLRQSRLDLEIQDTYVHSERLRIVGGAGLRDVRGESQTYLGGSASDRQWRVFSNLEYKPLEPLTLNVGAYYERSRISGASLSSRVAANYRLSSTQTVRLAWSSGTRTPDLQEQRANWSYSASDATPLLNGSPNVRFYQSAVSPGGLRSERIYSTELGYVWNVPTWGLLFDARLFQDRMKALVSEKLQFTSFAPTNTGGLRMSGVELQASAQLSAAWAGFAQYTYLRSYEATTPIEQTQYSRHSGALGVTHAFGDGWRVAFAYVGASGNGIGQRSFGREDLTVSKSFAAGPGRARLSATLRRLDNKSTSVYRDETTVNASSFRDRLQLFGQLQLSF